MDIPQQFPPLLLPQLTYSHSLALLLGNLIAKGNTAGAVRALEQVRMRNAVKQAQRSSASAGAKAQRSKQERVRVLVWG